MQDGVGRRERAELGSTQSHFSLSTWEILGSAPNWRHRLAWAVLITAACLAALLAVFCIAVEFNQTKVHVTIHSISAGLEEVSFPSVTLCNINQAGNQQRYLFIFKY